MNTSDSICQIGETHQVCEDFTLHGQTSHGTTSWTYSILCDGCSSSMMENGRRLPINVDTGARIQALAARKVIHDSCAVRGSVPGASILDNAFHKFIERNILKEMREVCTLFDIPTMVLDATLLISIWETCPFGDKLFVMIIGDGAFVIQTPRLKLITNVEFESGAPYYLSYRLNEDRNEAYKKEFGDEQKITSRMFWKDGKLDINSVASSPFSIYKSYGSDIIFSGGLGGPGGFLGIELEENEEATLTILSDGIQSFHHIGGDRINPFEMANQLTDFKGAKKGVFAVRRMNLTNRWCRKSDPVIVHDDDISIASIHRPVLTTV